MNESDQQPQAHHLRHTAWTIILWTIAVLFTGAGILCFIGFFIATPPPGSTEGSEIGVVITTLCIGLVTGFFAWERRPVHADHPKGQNRLASRQFARIVDGKVVNDGSAAGETSANSPGPDPAIAPRPSSLPPDRWTLRRALNDARVHAAIAVIALGISIILLFNALDGNAQSAYTQSHGLAVLATVNSYDNTQSCDHGNCSYTFSATARLSSPINGTSTTTVHGQNAFPGYQGEVIKILVDPKQPSYAELPGNRLRRVGGIIGVGIAIGILALVAVLLCNRALRRHPKRLPNRHIRRGSDPIGLS